MAITRGNAKYWDAFTPSTSAPTATTANKTYTGSHYMESAYKTLKTICTTVDAEFKIQNDGTIDVGPSTSLFTGHENNTDRYYCKKIIWFRPRDNRLFWRRFNNRI